MQDSEKLNRLKDNLPVLKNRAMDYITIGVGCNCLVVLFETGVLHVLLISDCISLKEIEVFGNPTCIASALTSLEKSEVVIKRGNDFYLTEFGRVLSEYIGLISIFFNGYANVVSQQGRIAKNKITHKKNLIKGELVAKAAVLISEKAIDPTIIREIIELNLSGTICDLGCGYAMLLSKICKTIGNAGLGFENEPKVVEQVRKKLQKSNVRIKLADVANLHGIWEDVVILMQRHVFHDFTPDKKCIDIMNSYLTTFPNMKYFLYIDTVAPSAAHNNLLPGFDYIHGLLGITMRTYEKTLQMFSASMYDVVKEVLLDIPNTFLWLLSPCKNSNVKYHGTASYK